MRLESQWPRAEMACADAREKEVAQFTRRCFDHGRLSEAYEDDNRVDGHQQADGRENQRWPSDEIRDGQVLFLDGDATREIGIGNFSV